MMRPEPEARRISVRGVVQGVGFRPFVWRLAERHGLTGWVRNTDGVVEIHLEGPPASLDAFVEEIGGSPPPLALVEDVSWTSEDVHGFPGFDVDVSVEGAAGDRLVPPDAATCDACLRELFDPDDRRYRYPFINCTDCGPRFTIIESLPYDRARTSMRDFPMCEACRQEYEDPGDRRFHAEPVACPACGPRVELRDALGEAVSKAMSWSSSARCSEAGRSWRSRGSAGSTWRATRPMRGPCGCSASGSGARTSRSR